MHQPQGSADTVPDAQKPQNQSKQHDGAGSSGSGPSDVRVFTHAGARSLSPSTSAADVPNVEQTAAMLKLDIDCCEEVFDYLPFHDLINRGNTCKRLNKVIGFILHQYYPGIYPRCKNDGVFMDEKLKINHLVEYIQKMRLTNVGYFWNIRTKCHRIRQMHLVEIHLTEPKVDCLKLALQKVEDLRLAGCTLDGDFYEKFLKFQNKNFIGIRNQ